MHSGDIHVSNKTIGGSLRPSSTPVVGIALPRNQGRTKSWKPSVIYPRAGGRPTSSPDSGMIPRLQDNERAPLVTRYRRTLLPVIPVVPRALRRPTSPPSNMGQLESMMPEKQVEDVVGDVEMNLDLESIPPDVEEYARTKVGETPETRIQGVEDLRELIYQRGDVTPLKMDDDYLLRFLRARNFKLEPSYKLLVNYCHFREENFYLYDKVNPLDFYYIGEADIISVLPYRDQNGRRILIYKVGKWDPSRTHIDDLFKAGVAAMEAGALEPRAQILGGVAIFDMEGLTLQHAVSLTPSVVSRFFQIMVTSFPMKATAIHIINESWIFEKIFSMFKPLLGKRYSESLFFHGNDLSSLHKHVEPKYLPKTYGGVRPDYGYLEWFRQLKKNSKVVKAMEELGYVSLETKQDNST